VDYLVNFQPVQLGFYDQFSIGVNSSDLFQHLTLNFTPAGDALYQFGFQDNSSDNVGALLDNVSISAVPEPETYAMLLVGLGLIGFSGRRNKKA